MEPLFWSWSPMVVLHTILIISFRLWCMPVGSVWFQMNSNLFRLLEGQTHNFSTSWHAKMSLTLNESRYRMFFVQTPCHYLQASLKSSDQEIFWHNRVEILVFASPTGYMLTLSSFLLVYILWNSLKWLVIFLQSWTSTSYFSNSTGSSVTNCRFFPIIAKNSIEHGRCCMQNNQLPSPDQKSCWGGG